MDSRELSGFTDDDGACDSNRNCKGCVVGGCRNSSCSLDECASSVSSYEYIPAALKSISFTYLFLGTAEGKAQLPCHSSWLRLELISTPTISGGSANFRGLPCIYAGGAIAQSILLTLV